VQSNNIIKKGTILELTIDKLAYGGNGISKYEGMIIFTKNVLPGQTVKVKIIKNKKTYLEAICLEKIKKSSFEKKERCNHFNDCGGCKTQNLDYTEQTNQKYQQVIESLNHLGKIKIKHVNPIIKSKNIFEYRNKMEFSFSNNRWLINNEKGNTNEKDKNFALGLHPPRRFDKIVDIDNCDIQTKISNKILQQIKIDAISNKLTPYDIINHKGFLRNIIIKHPKFSNEVMVNIVTAYKDEDALAPLVQSIKNISKNIKSIINTINNKKSDVSYGEPKNILFGNDYIYEILDNYKFKISADSFFQTNSMQALEMYQHIKNECKLTGQEIIYDFYCGTGTISIFVAKHAKDVFGFEIVESAICDAKENAKLNNINNTHFYCGDLSKMLTEYKQIINKNPCDVLILDPPRAGLHPKTLKEIIAIDAKKIIYASCNPTTQARDVRELINSNYIIGCVQPIDMFPHTHHIECVITLDKKND